jgi:hypothetical protein
MNNQSIVNVKSAELFFGQFDLRLERHEETWQRHAVQLLLSAATLKITSPKTAMHSCQEQCRMA